MPVDEWVDGGQPGLSKDEIIVGERVNYGIKGVGVVVMRNGEGAGVGRERRRAIWEDDRNGRASNAGERVVLTE